jgi:hypothetical protein
LQQEAVDVIDDDLLFLIQNRHATSIILCQTAVKHNNRGSWGHSAGERCSDGARVDIIGPA